MRTLNLSLIALALPLLAALALGAPAFSLGTPDGLPPAFEETCNPLRSMRGPAFGLCNAYCEAMDCHCFNEESCQPSASPRACSQVRRNFMRQTASDVPCELGVACPCLDDDNWTSKSDLWFLFATGTIAADSCELTGGVFVTGETQQGIPVSAGVDTVNDQCLIGGEIPDALPITDEEAEACAALLRGAQPLCS